MKRNLIIRDDWWTVPPIKVGIVGASTYQWNSARAEKAKRFIENIIRYGYTLAGENKIPDYYYKYTIIVSGHCNPEWDEELGGVDIWAETLAKQLMPRKPEIYPAEIQLWPDIVGRIDTFKEQSRLAHAYNGCNTHCLDLKEGYHHLLGYKSRNLKVATADLNYLYSFSAGAEGVCQCYHCTNLKNVPLHKKNGGCWTANVAESYGVKVFRVVVN